MNKMITALVVIVVGYTGVLAVLFLFQRNLMYHPSAGVMDPAHYGLRGVDRVEVVTPDGIPLTAWYRAASPGQPTLLYFHGNAGHIGHRAGKIQPYLDAGLGVFLLSYRGFGSNPGYPTENRLYADAIAAFDYLENNGVPVFKIVLYGESLGSGIAVEIAMDRGFGAVVLESPFTSMVNIAAHHLPYFPARYLVRDKYDSISKLPRLRAPLLILHGERDRTVPVKFGRALFDAAPEPKEFRAFPGAGHNNLYDFDAPQQVIDFLQRKIPPSP